MARRKAEEDALARTAAERFVGEALEALGLVDAAPAGPTELGRALLGQVAKYVEFERGESTDPDRQKVAMRRMVITTPWEVDPEAVAQQ